MDIFGELEHINMLMEKYVKVNLLMDIEMDFVVSNI
jgi:hypothetical protein